MLTLVSAVTLTLENKNSTTWDVIVDGTYGELEYDAVGSEFVYSLTATGLLTTIGYSLIYYADPWPGNNPGALIGTGITDSSGDLIMSGNTELDTMLPSEDDENFADGAKIWLIPSSAYNAGTNSVIVWPPTTQWLFEDELIIYADTNEACVVFTTPEEGDYVNGNQLNIVWNYDSCASTSYDLQYKEGTCTSTDDWSDPLGNFGTSSTEYDWDISTLDDGEYCLKFSNGNDRGFSGLFTIDNENPTIEFTDAPYFVVKENSITITADIEDNELIESYEIEFGDSNENDQDGIDSSTYSVSEAHTYASEGKYIVTLTVTDEAGNSATETTMVVVGEEQPDWMVPLYANRMNLISIPLVPEDTDYREVLDGVRENLNRIWAYTCDLEDDKCENDWEFRKTTTNSWSSSGSLNDIVPGYGYIVFMDEDDVLYGNARTVTGDPEDAPMIPSEIHLSNGYNLIGHFGTTTQTIDNALASLKSLSDDAYWYKVLDVNWEEVIGNLESGEGYWISMKHLPDTVTEDYYTYYI